MARNLQAKLPSSDTLRIYDINPQTLERFANETKALSKGASVEIAENVREAAENSVGPLVLEQLIYILSSASASIK
jgi:3-hydroxyisobutyrate/3-hydroxypropionate dehydrogenase